MPTCVKCHVLTSTSKRCPSCRTCYCSKACRSADWSRHKSECTSGERVSSGSTSSNMEPSNAALGKGRERTSLRDEYQCMFSNEPRENDVSLTSLQILTHSQLNFLNIMDKSLQYLYRAPGFGLR